MPLLRIILFAAIALTLLEGCEGIPGKPPGIAPPPGLDRAARDLLAQGRFQEAAQEYLRLASTQRPPARHFFELSAAGALVDGGDLEAARNLLARFETVPLVPEVSVRRQILLARIALEEHRVDQALAALTMQVPPDMPPALAAQIHRIRALAFSRVGNHLEAARERVMLELFLRDADAIRANRRIIWTGLANLTPAALEHARVPPPNTFGGWLELALAAKNQMLDPKVFGQAMQTWRVRFPGHPASQEIVPELMELSHVATVPPRRVALLLPFDGPFAHAGAAVRDGFLAARFDDPPEGIRPAVSIHNSSGADIRALYQQVVEAGADLVVGPLEKESVAALMGTEKLPVPTLALNHVVPEPENPGAQATVSSTEGLYQFALSPEAETRQVAERAWFDGHLHAAMLSPQGPWGERVAKVFTTAWQQLGGIVVEHQTYSNQAQTMSDPVKRLLNVDESESRWRALKQYLHRDLKHESRRRQDVDFVFLAAFPQQARQLRPQLDYYHASAVPVYATSHVFSGTVNTAADRDVDGVRFGDMPWVLVDEGPEALLRRRLVSAWPAVSDNYLKLYAFGIDAYRIIPHLRRLRAQRVTEIQGTTGRLSVDGDNRVRRKLLWARFEDGKPRISGPNSSTNDWHP